MRQKFAATLRRLHLLSAAELTLYLANYVKHFNENQMKEKENPDFPFPPSFLMYDAYSSTRHQYYMESGKRTAAYLSDLIKSHAVDATEISVLEWGCGPGRILRHLPPLLPGASMYGSDYNKKSIVWLQNNITEIQFGSNELEPPLPFPEKLFDVIYSISVFTHLSERMHEAWAAEIHRRLNPGGFAIISTHGDACRGHLTESEMKKYDAGELVVRGNVYEGSRIFAAYQSPRFVRDRLLNHFEIEQHIPGPTPVGLQDLWVGRKRASQ